MDEMVFLDDWDLSIFNGQNEQDDRETSRIGEIDVADDYDFSI